VPLYAYRCTQCGHRFEKIQNFSAAPELVCPKCQGLLERPLTAPRLHFKGAGWYVNDYAAKSSEPAGESVSIAASAESAAPAATNDSAPSSPSVPAAASAPAPTPAPTSTPAPTTSN
jgi:putative FmdB family regulatory protein